MIATRKKISFTDPPPPPSRHTSGMNGGMPDAAGNSSDGENVKYQIKMKTI
jgi:hypothetical protein